MTTHSHPTLISGTDLIAVSGGQLDMAQIFGFLTIGTIVETVLHVGHVRETYNYAAERIINGCQNLEEGDHFSYLFCGYPK